MLSFVQIRSADFDLETTVQRGEYTYHFSSAARQTEKHKKFMHSIPERVYLFWQRKHRKQTAKITKKQLMA